MNHSSFVIRRWSLVLVTISISMIASIARGQHLSDAQIDALADRVIQDLRANGGQPGEVTKAILGLQTGVEHGPAYHSRMLDKPAEGEKPMDANNDKPNDKPKPDSPRKVVPCSVAVSLHYYPTNANFVVYSPAHAVPAHAMATYRYDPRDGNRSVLGLLAGRPRGFYRYSAGTYPYAVPYGYDWRDGRRSALGLLVGRPRGYYRYGSPGTFGYGF